jgi:dTDP-4-dehydrorhamnose 3,5-epimerase
MTEPPGRGDARPESAFRVPLSDDIQGAISFQSYSRPPTIHGVEMVPLRKHRAENGWFAEVFRLTGGVLEKSHGPSIELRQVSAAYSDPFRINAFHIHPKLPQDELWVVLHGSMTVWLVDCRRDSPTLGMRQREQLSAEEPTFLLIPAGVAHGYRAGPEGALLVYGMNQQFDASDPNEGRLPWDHFGEDLWEEDRG